jgi:hypothetical protein
LTDRVLVETLGALDSKGLTNLIRHIVDTLGVYDQIVKSVIKFFIDSIGDLDKLLWHYGKVFYERVGIKPRITSNIITVINKYLRREHPCNKDKNESR